MYDMVFSLTEDGVSPLRPAAFDREVDLQRLVEQAPELLGGSIMTPGDPRRFLLIASEGSSGRSRGRWSAILR